MLDEVAHLVFGVEAPKIAGRFAVDEALRDVEPKVMPLPYLVTGGVGNCVYQRRITPGATMGDVDWILVHISKDCEPLDFCAFEVQTIDTTGNFRDSF